LEVVTTNPACEREEVATVGDHAGLGWGDISEPFPNSGFGFDEGVGAGDGEDGFSSSDLLSLHLLTIVEFDA
jgi:hypothetical protein